MNVVYLGLGGNIGHVENSIDRAITHVNKEVGSVRSRSFLYETEPWGVSGQQNYLNICIAVETKLSSLELIKTLLSIELELGRKRQANGDPIARTIDIDILFFNDEVVQYPQLIIPHPRLHLRKFVLIPLCDIAPDYVHPVLKDTLSNLLKACEDNSEVKRVGK